MKRYLRKTETVFNILSVLIEQGEIEIQMNSTVRKISEFAVPFIEVISSRTSGVIKPKQVAIVRITEAGREWYEANK